MCAEDLTINGSEVKIEAITPLSPEQAVEYVKSVINKEDTTADTEDKFLNQFSDKPVTEDPDKSRDKLKGMIEYLKSKKFKKDVDRKSYKTGIPPRQIARGIISKAFGIVGDLLGIVIDTASGTLNALIDLLSNILHGAVNLVAGIADGLSRVVTFNKTAVGNC